MTREYSHVLGMFYNTPLALDPTKAREIEALLQARLRNGRGNLDFTAAAPVRSRSDGPFARVDDVALIPIMGVISPRPSIMSSGGTSAQEIGRAYDAAAADKSINTIVSEVDSPGGSVQGVVEASDRIYAARQQKRVVMAVNGIAASAAYWLASQGSEIVITPSGAAGSIGVIAAHQDTTGAEEQAGIRTTYISAGRYKAESYKPLTDEAAAAIQADVDAFYSMFLAAVARGRGVSTARVESSYGQGRMLLARAALAAGLADRMGTIEDAFRSVQRGGSRPSGSARERGIRERTAQMAKLGIPTGSAGDEDRKRAQRNRIADMAGAGLPLPPVKY